ncbi:MAG: DUF2201 family putative metallopeptidase [Coriobacteriales bacterium]
MEPQETEEARQREFERRLVDLARRILEECRVDLMMSFRFLDTALWKMPLIPRQLSGALATDCRCLYFDPVKIIRIFRRDQNRISRMLLHSILHCIFRHPLKTTRKQPKAWTIACDLSVEAISLEMCDGRFVLESDSRLGPNLSDLGEEIGSLTPMKIYRRLLEGPYKDPLPALRKLLLDTQAFGLDSHELWDLSSAEDEDRDQGDNGQQGEGDEESDSGDGDSSQDEAGESKDDVSNRNGQDDSDADDLSNDDSTQGAHQENDEREDENGQQNPAQGTDESEDETQEEGSGESDSSQADSETSQGMAGGQGDGDGNSYTYEEGELGDNDFDPDEDWTRIAQQVQVDLETLSKRRGEGAGNMMANLELANRSEVDYADFLRRFSTISEEMILNDEEFDYIFYTYGLNRYGNVPLIEPLEYKETNRVREFVIAVDTSGSCSGELVRTFLTRTYEILQETEEFGAKVNVHIIQADAQIQQDTKIEDVKQFRDYEKGFEVLGMGGTDFRPVFAYVDELLAQGEFEDLRGLIYFTDGFGVFPARQPDYDTAFVFVEEEGKTRRVPPWAMKVVIDQDTIMDM